MDTVVFGRTMAQSVTTLFNYLNVAYVNKLSDQDLGEYAMVG